MEDTVYIAPDSVWDYSYVDSVTKKDKAYSYDSYGDSSILYKIPTEGLPN